MQEHEFSEVIDLIRKEDARFSKGAYHFVRQGLDYTLKKLDEEEPDRGSRHVSGPQLLEGFREFALDRYGPMTYTVLTEWGITECRHLGEIVFQLVDYGVLGKTENDKLEDFCDGYDFDGAFLEPFRPRKKPTTKGRAASSRDQK